MGQKFSNGVSGICERISQVRVELTGPRGKSNFARMLGLSASTYDYYEAGRFPPVDVVLKISEVANVDLYWLLTGESSANAPGYDNPIVQRAAKMLRKYPHAAEQLSAFLDILSKTLEMAPPNIAPKPNLDEQAVQDVISESLPTGWIPILGRSAAGLSHFWKDAENVTDLTTLGKLINEYIDSLEKTSVALTAKAGCSAPEIPGNVQLITVKKPLPPIDSVEFIASENLQQKYVDAFGLRIDGDSMSPEVTHGDIVILSPSIKAKSGDLAVVQLEGAIGVTCKLFQADGEQVNLVAINENYPPAKHEMEKIEWALKVLARIRPK